MPWLALLLLGWQLTVPATAVSNRVQYKHPLFAGEYGASAYANLTRFRSALTANVYAALDSGQDYTSHSHRLFSLFQPYIHCPPGHPIAAYGVGDGEKLACSPLVFGSDRRRRCVIYSLGSNMDFSFEESVLAKTDCDVVTLDCTVSGKMLPGGRHQFLKKCVGSPKSAASDARFWTLEQTMKHFGHTEISFLKMDIETFEFGVLSSWQEADTLPLQIAFELHYEPTYPDVFGERYPDPLVALSFLMAHVSNLGYAIVSKVDNVLCDHCTELLVLRVERTFHRK